MGDAWGQPPSPKGHLDCSKFIIQQLRGSGSWHSHSPSPRMLGPRKLWDWKKRGWPELEAPHINTSQSIRDRAGAEVSRTLSPRVSAIQAPEQPGDSSARELARKIMGKPR